MPTQAPPPRAPSPDSQHPSPPWSTLILGNISLAVAYALSGMLALMLTRDTALASPVWPAAGLAFAIVFVRGTAYLPGVLLGSLTTNMPTLLRSNHSATVAIAIALSIAIGASLGTLVGSLITRRVVGQQPRLIKARQILFFLVLAGPITGAISASIGTTVLVVSSVLPMNQVLLSWFTWWVGDTLGIVVFTPITMILLPEQHSVWHGRRWKIIAPSIIVLGLVMHTLLQNARMVFEQRLEQFRHDAYYVVQSLDSRLSIHKDILAAIASLQKTTQGVSQQEFATFTKPFLERHRALQGLSWNPVIKAEQRHAYETAQRAQPALSNFRIMEKNAAGELVPAGDRAEFVPVGYIEPLASNQAALGFDVYSNPIRADAIDRARRVGNVQVTAPIQLVQDQDMQQGVLMFLATTNSAGSVDGFAAGVYRMNNLLAGSVSDSMWRSWNFVLTDTTDANHPIPLTEHRVDSDSTHLIPSPKLVASEPMEIGGRIWTLQAWPSQALLATFPASTPILLLTGVLTIAFLLEAFLLLVTGLEFQWRGYANASTYKAHHDDLTGLLNRRGLFEHLRSIQAEQTDSAAKPTPERTHVLMFLDLDGFKQVNDGGGHEAGDMILRKIAEALHASARQGDSIARIGGDEFVILAWDCTLENGLQIAHAAQRAVTSVAVVWKGVSHSVGVSIGVSEIVSSSSMSIDDFLRQADAACYAAKHAGRNTVRVFASA